MFTSPLSSPGQSWIQFPIERDSDENHNVYTGPTAAGDLTDFFQVLGVQNARDGLEFRSSIDEGLALPTGDFNGTFGSSVLPNTDAEPLAREAKCLGLLGECRESRCYHKGKRDNWQVSCSPHNPFSTFQSSRVCPQPQTLDGTWFNISADEEPQHPLDTNDSSVIIASSIPSSPTVLRHLSTSQAGPKPTSASLRQFCERVMGMMIQENMDPHMVIAFIRREVMRTPGAGTSRRRREAIPHRSRTCSECGTNGTTQWRRHPDSQEVLCNSCGQRAGRARRMMI
ncbi:hypothetical protein R3P38DRAFT_2810564 [Favolaschia claudopus]|uniref:GATA-type domain-containing protein n=1 Tax=Favolaschia claudopus TaxID=2862362 RepID=A0AAV9ZAD4_9AGAR